jgi:hypothetical protein
MTHQKTEPTPGVEFKLKGFHQCGSTGLAAPGGSGLFGVWVWFGSVTEFSNLRLHQSLNLQVHT